MVAATVIVLAVNSSSSSLSVAVTRDGEVLGESVLIAHHEHVENLATLIKKLTADVGLDIEQIDGFGVATGPGSFSGIRVGLATIKGMALALSKPAMGISTLEILACAALEPGESGAPVIDARRGQIYTALYTKKGALDLVLEEGPLLLSAEDFLERPQLSYHSILVCGDSGSSLPAELANVVNRRLKFSTAFACAQLAEERFRLGDRGELHRIAPLYIRRSDAEEKREAFKGEHG